MTTHTFRSLVRRLSKAGFKQSFVRSAILPEWWDDDCEADPDLLPEVEVRVARFIGLPLSIVKDPARALAPPEYASAKLRRVRDLDHDRLAPAIHAALRIGEAVARNLRDPAPVVQTPPADGLEWRREIQATSGPVTLDSILGDLWHRGIPVVSLDVLPAPSFQGVAAVVEGRPVILLGHRHDAPGRVAFFVGHEAGHIAASDCAPNQPVVDEDDEILDDAAIERRADRYAKCVLIGADSIPQLECADFKQLATQAVELERKTGADASVLIFAWAARTGDYGTATLAVRALYRDSGARRQLRQHFDRHVDLESASESDYALLHCVHGASECNETAA